MNGFIDIQVNGLKGIDFSSADLTADGIRQVTTDLVSDGTLAYCPTIITGSMEMYEHNLRMFSRVMAEPAMSGHMIGIHLEGPFISSFPGARGVHQPEFVRPPSVEDFKQFQEWANGKIAILTVAPGEPGIEGLIECAVGEGVVVSLGHHFASDDAMERAVAAGASCGTHIGNGIPNTIDRHKNPIWWQLACDDLYGSFITDGHHLPPALIKVALRAKEVGRFIVTSDLSPIAKSALGEHQFLGKTVVVEPSGRIFCPESNGLAGSNSTMLDCMNYLASLDLLSEEDLWRVGRDNPFKLLGRSLSDLQRSKAEVLFEEGRFIIGKTGAAP